MRCGYLKLGLRFPSSNTGLLRVSTLLLQCCHSNREGRFAWGFGFDSLLRNRNLKRLLPVFYLTNSNPVQTFLTLTFKREKNKYAPC